MIYIKTEKEINTISDLLKELYSDAKSPDNFIWTVTTYSDPECKYEQCDNRRRRSFDDVHELILTYFPDAELKDIVHEIVTLDLYWNDKKCYLYPAHCGDISKITIYYYTVQHSWMDLDEIYKYDSKYSWEELLNLIRIKDYSNYKEYIEKHKKEELVAA